MKRGDLTMVCPIFCTEIACIAAEHGTFNGRNGDSPVPSGNLTNIAIENHHFQWVNPLFLWPFSIAILT